MSNVSPLPTPSPAIQLMDFYDALQSVRAGGKVTKAEWNNPAMVLMMVHDPEQNKDILCINAADGELDTWFHPLSVSDGDIDGQDWVLV